MVDAVGYDVVALLVPRDPVEREELPLATRGGRDGVARCGSAFRVMRARAQAAAGGYAGASAHASRNLAGDPVERLQRVSAGDAGQAELVTIGGSDILRRPISPEDGDRVIDLRCPRCRALAKCWPRRGWLYVGYASSRRVSRRQAGAWPSSTARTCGRAPE